ncbi:U-box domain-containing protein 7 [Punica granatum]|uniref:Uncharacterized protein n=2 Tax=Punica granatum TaxID=22663 RepID=A0A218VT36_PUNGR|nr:U-box domain-containing protein 7 [Punica granatum]OWM63483.1 hypothetical protein CDL15_Pgr026243 [Punica granatum]PKI47301.1 hypothetical protein CRG98_032310 [Punica granatum]
MSSSSSTSSSSSSSVWQLSYRKLRFFTRIRRFLRSKTAGTANHKSSSKSFDRSADNNINSAALSVNTGQAVEEHDSSTILQRAVKRLHFGGPEEKKAAAIEIERLAREDVKVKKLMAELRVIPALVEMVAAIGQQQAAVGALLELANGTYTNKAVMVEAGILSKLPRNIDTVDELTRHELSELLLSLSSPKNIHLPLDSSQVIPFTLAVLDSDSGSEIKESCLETLYNLSTVLENAAKLGSDSCLVGSIMRVVSSLRGLSEKALATIGNIVVTFPGKKAVENCGLVPESLIEVLTWEDNPKCQELSAYVLMVLAHHSSAQRAKMAAAGIVPVLLEVALLGSPLAQKRALKLLQWFKDDRQVRVGPHSGPQTPRVPIGSPIADHCGAREGKRMMQRLVKESLHKNMELITKRANVDPGSSSSSSRLKSLVVSTSSKSLPY